MNNGHPRRFLAPDGEIFGALPRSDWLAMGVVTVVCGAAGFLLLGALPGAAVLIFGALAVAVAACDARLMLIPDVLSLALFVSGLTATTALTAFAPGDTTPDGGWPATLMLGLAGAALGGAVLGGLRWLWLRARGIQALGFGDVKLAAALGAWLGPADLCTAILIAALAGLAAAGVESFRGGTATGSPRRLPFGAFLAPASWLVFVLMRL